MRKRLRKKRYRRAESAARTWLRTMSRHAKDRGHAREYLTDLGRVSYIFGFRVPAKGLFLNANR